MKKTLLLTLPLFLSACSNKRIIDDAMQSIGSQSQFINTLPDPKTPMWVVLLLGLLVILLIVAIVFLAWSSHSHKKMLEEAQKRQPRRVTKKVYVPMPNPQSPTGYPYPGSQPNSVSYTPTQAHPQYLPGHAPIQPSPWRQR